MRHSVAWLVLVLWMTGPLVSFAQQDRLQLNDREYFERGGVNVMAFQDIYPEGHQGGVSILQHGIRTASNGDLRLEPTPGQWQPVPKQYDRAVDPANNVITSRLAYPESFEAARRLFPEDEHVPMLHGAAAHTYRFRRCAHAQRHRVCVGFGLGLLVAGLRRHAPLERFISYHIAGRAEGEDGRDVDRLWDTQLEGQCKRMLRAEYIDRAHRGS